MADIGEDIDIDYSDENINTTEQSQTQTQTTTNPLQPQKSNGSYGATPL